MPTPRVFPALFAAKLLPGELLPSSPPENEAK